MIVRLTHAQADSVRKRINTFHAELLAQHRTTHGRTQHDYDMPAIAWRQILDALVRQCYGPAGGKLKGTGRPADSCYLAIKKIADAVRKIEAHPALRGAAVEGFVGDVIPAWESACREWSPYPILDNPVTLHHETFVLFIPHHSHNLGMKVTTWAAIQNFLKPGEVFMWSLARESHLQFVEMSADPERLADHEDVPPLIVG